MAFKMKGFSPFDKEVRPLDERAKTAQKKAEADADREKASTKEGGHTAYGTPDSYTTASGKKISSAGVDEGNLSTVKVDGDGNKYVVVQEDARDTPAGTKLFINE